MTMTAKMQIQNLKNKIKSTSYPLDTKLGKEIMSKRIKRKKKTYKQALKICKEMLDPHISRDVSERYVWNSLTRIECADLKMYENLGYTYEDLEDEIMRNRQFNFILIKIVQRCISESFPIQEYFLFEIPYSDSEGVIWSFVNQEDYEDYHIRGLHNTKLRWIDFWVSHKGCVTPLKLIGSIQIEVSSCSEALYET